MARKPTQEMIETYGYSRAAVIMAEREAKRKKKVVRKKKPPVRVPDVTAAALVPQTAAPPKPVRPKPPKPITPTMMDRRPKPRPAKPKPGHVPTEFEYVPPENLLRGTHEDRERNRQIQRYNQQRERERRAELKRAREARRERQALVRKLTKRQREVIGHDTLKDYIENGPRDRGFSLGDVPGIAGAVVRGIGRAGHAYGERARQDPLRPARDVYSAIDWWVNKAPEAVLGKHEKGKGWEGGLAEAWNQMSTEEQIDTIVGGKSMMNVLKGQNLSPENIARAISLAVAAPIPWGKGFPSLASVLLRGGFSAAEVKVMLKTGEGLREALAVTKTPVRPFARVRSALSGGKSGGSRLLHPVYPADSEVIARWRPAAARIGKDAVARAEHMPVVTLRDPVGNLRAVAAYEHQGDMLVVREIAGEGKGSGQAMMKELAKEAASESRGIRLIAESDEAAAFYQKIGMKPMGKSGFVWEPEDVVEYASTPLPPPPGAAAEGQLFTLPEDAEIPMPEVFRFTSAEAEELPMVPGIWYHGTSAANADEIERTGVLKVGTRSDPPGAWLTANPRHAAFHGDTVIMIQDDMIPAEAERISAFGGMVNSPIDIALSRAAAGAPTPPPAAVSPIARDIATEIHASGLALPPELDTPETLARAIEDVFALADEGAYGKDWYKTAAQQVLRVAEHTGKPPKQIAQLFAIFSQAADTVSNATFVFDATRQFEKFDDLFAGRFPVRQSEEALAVLKGGTWEGRKRSSFYANILRHIPGMEDEYAAVIKAMAESRGAPIEHPVTVDRWVVRMFRPDAKKDIPEQYYDTFETIMQRMAAHKGWEPEQIQAAAWVSTKTRALEKEMAKKGRRTVRHIAGGGDAFEHGVNRQLEREAQGELFKGLQTTPQARRLANQVNKKWGGFTVNADLTPVPETGYSVTYSLTEEAYPLHRIKASDIEQFAERHKKLLRSKRNKIGGFSDDQNPVGDGTDLSYLSVTRHFPSDSAQSKAAAVRFAREQGQETVYEYKTGDGIRTGLSREEQQAIIQGLSPTPLGPKVQLPPTQPEQEYRAYLDRLVRQSGKGKRGISQEARDKVEEETLKLAERYPDDPEFEEFLRLREAVYPTEQKLPSWLADESGTFNLGGFRGPIPARTLQYGDRVEEFTPARSAITRQLIERPADWVSTRLADEESKAAAMVNKLLPTASAKARVAKQAGRNQILEASRAQAKMMDNVHALPDMNSPEDIAHFYWAQLPADQRNVEGLRLVRQAQLDEVEEITSGRMLESIEAQIGAVKAQLAETQDLRLLGELEDLKVLATDIPLRLEDLTVSIAKLEKLIAKPPALKPEVIDAVRGLSTERRRLLEEAGLLKGDRAAAREGLMSTWLGLEPTGEEVFIGHRLGKVRGAQSQLMPVSPGVGRPRVPQGLSENKLVLARTGRMRTSTHVAAEDWQAAQTYRQALMARDDLASMGKPFTGRVPEGHMLVNPKGRAVPAHWKTDKLAKIEELDDDELREVAEQMMKGFLADAGGADQMVEDALAAGVKWDELRVIPEGVVKRYYAQFTPASGTTRAGKAYDAAVDFTAASIVFARVGYIPKNIAQNLIMSVPHQGPFMLVNIPRAAQALLDPQLRHFLHAEVGFSGAAHGIGQELRYGQKARGIPGKAASFVGKIADDPARFSAFIHEAAAVGIIPKYSAHLSEADRAALLNLFTNPEMRSQLNVIRSRAVEAMADFSRLNPTQRRWARRFLIIPGWLWAGSRYPFHFAATHPVRSAAIGYVAAGEPYGDKIGLPQNPPITDLFADNLPPFIEGIEIPESFPVFGGKIFRTTSLSPVSTPYDIALALGGQSPETAASYANPLAKSVWNISNRQVDYPGGSYRTGYQESIIRNLERVLPNWTFIAQEISPEDRGRYPEDESRLGRFFRELGVVPIKIIGDEARDDKDWEKQAEEISGGPVPPEVMQLRKVHNANVEAERKYRDEHDVPSEAGLIPQRRLAVLAQTVAILDPSKKAQADALEAQAMTMTDEEAEAAIREGRERLGLTRYDAIQDKLGEARTQRTESGMRNAGQHD